MPAFIPPSLAVQKLMPPNGKGWLHELKFDGFRVQLHSEPVIYSRNGSDFTKRFRSLVPHLQALPPAIIDAELVACDGNDKPDFRALLFGSKNLCLWCFDLISPGVSAFPLITRRHHLKQLLKGQEVLRLSETFADPTKLLQACEDMGLEGIVSKNAGQPYKSGRNLGWIKVKTSTWRATNADRWELFDKATRT